jgi:hypothetical protein
VTKFLTVRGLPASFEVEETRDIPEAQNISQHFFSAYRGTSFWGASYFSSTLPPLNLVGNGLFLATEKFPRETQNICFIVFSPFASHGGF